MQPSTPILNIAAYRFALLGDLPPLREKLRLACEQAALKGTILLAPEGINLFMAGAPEAVEKLVGLVKTLPGCSDIEVKRSWSETVPFKRLRVKLKREIITLNRPEINPALTPAPAVAPQTLKRWLDAGRDDAGREIVLLDTRNAFEVETGTFTGARHCRIGSFTEFPDAVAAAAQEEAFSGKTVVTFCTGGIRCEKAAPYMERLGVENVFQLSGGILRYFEECGSAHYDGTCFVFDERVALDPELQPAK